MTESKLKRLKVIFIDDTDAVVEFPYDPATRPAGSWLVGRISVAHYYVTVRIPPSAVKMIMDLV